MGKNVSNNNSQKLLDNAKKSAMDEITASKRAIGKKAEATGDLIGNKIANKITSVSKKKHIQKMNLKYKKKVHFSRERKQIINELTI